MDGESDSSDEEARERAALAHTPILRDAGAMGTGGGSPPKGAAVGAAELTFRGTNRNLRCSTKPHVARAVWKRAWEEIAKRKRATVTTVWDAFAGIGVDTVEAARRFQRVLATECDPHTFRRLQGNVHAAGLHSQQVLLRCANCLVPGAGTSDFPIGLLYFDPPWGHDYRKEAFADLRLDTAPAGNKPTLGRVYETLRTAVNPQFALIKMPAGSNLAGPWGAEEPQDSVRIDHADDGVVFLLVRCCAPRDRRPQ